MPSHANKNVIHDVKRILSDFVLLLHIGMFLNHQQIYLSLLDFKYKHFFNK